MHVDIEARRLARLMCKPYFLRPCSPDQRDLCDSLAERVKSFLLQEVERLEGQQQSKVALNCIKCDKPLPNFAVRDNQPVGGTEFAGGGDYGSAITDIQDELFVVNVCDACLQVALDTGRAERIATDALQLPVAGE